MASILVTDDDATTRLMVRTLLKKAGYSVATASDGVKALQALQKRRFDLVLLDIWMPKMNGLGLLGRLHEEKYVPKIIVMTSDRTSDTLLDALRGREASSRVSDVRSPCSMLCGDASTSF